METEVFKDFEFGGMCYKVGNLGTIIGKKGIIKQRLNTDGYLTVTLGKGDKRTTKLIHRIVAILFVPNPNNLPEVNHKDYNRKNPRWDNLEWCNHKDNVKYSSNKGRYIGKASGEINGRAKITQEQAKEIRRLYNSGEITNKSELSRMFNIGWTTVKHILDNETWIEDKKLCKA